MNNLKKKMKELYIEIYNLHNLGKNIIVFLIFFSCHLACKKENIFM
jgi:hypothetical protein